MTGPDLLDPVPCRCGSDLITWGGFCAECGERIELRPVSTDSEIECYHPRSCRRCQACGGACGDHQTGDVGHERCVGRTESTDSGDPA